MNCESSPCGPAITGIMRIFEVDFVHTLPGLVRVTKTLDEPEIEN